MTEDAFRLERFVEAQDPVWETVVAELAAGRKTTHWMWFVFPQVAGLGSSPAARHYAISGLAEARAYLRHPVLGERLRHACRLLLDLPPVPIGHVLGSPDDMKLRSSMTLFAEADPSDPLFPEVLARYHHDGPDPATLRLLAGRT